MSRGICCTIVEGGWAVRWAAYLVICDGAAVYTFMT